MLMLHSLLVSFQFLDAFKRRVTSFTVNSSFSNLCFLFWFSAFWINFVLMQFRIVAALVHYLVYGLLLLACIKSVDGSRGRSIIWFMVFFSLLASKVLMVRVKCHSNQCTCRRLPQFFFYMWCFFWCFFFAASPHCPLT